MDGKALTEKFSRESHIPIGNRTKVWDGFVRVFHWGLVAGFAGCYWSAKAGLGEMHILVGYSIVVLFMARMIWGFTGNKYARFANYIVRPRIVISYLGDIIKGHPRRYLGHNPAGSAMVIALLACIAIVLGTGLSIQGVIEFDGPFHTLLSNISDAQAYLLRSVHETTVNIVIILVSLHIVGVAVASIQHRENLIAAMFSGYKSSVLGSAGHTLEPQYSVRRCAEDNKQDMSR